MENSVIVPRLHDRKGTQMMKYGIDLANRLSRPVRFGYGPRQQQGQYEEGEVDLRENRGVGLLTSLGANKVRGGFLFVKNSVRPYGNEIVISNDGVRINAGPVIVPFDEKKVTSNSSQGVMVPFGSGESGRYAFYHSAQLIKWLGLPVCFYHTTWKSPRTNSRDPKDHMCDEARKTLRFLESEACEHNISFHVTVEMTDSVARGALRRALIDDCRLLVVARGKTTGKGSYVDQWLEHSVIPMLIMQRGQS